MAIFSLLADLIHQCRLARWEEEHCTVDAVQLLPFESLRFPRFFCAGQFVKFKVCASRAVGASITLREPTTDGSPNEPLDYNAEVSSLILEHLCQRAGDYDLTIHNESDEPVDVAVEIHAATRSPSVRTRLEGLVNGGARLFKSRKVWVRVIPFAVQRQPPDKEDGSEHTGSSGAVDV
jgi:hypothetical protein